MLKCISQPFSFYKECLRLIIQSLEGSFTIRLTYYLYKLSGSLTHFDKLVCIPNILASYFDDDCVICRHMLVNE